MTDNVPELVRRLRRKTVGGVPVFPTPIENEAADALDSQQRTIEGLREECSRLEDCLSVMNSANSSDARTIEGLRKELASEKALNATNYWTDVEMNLQQNQKITDKDREAMLAVIKQLFDNKTAALSQSSQAGEGTPLHSTHDKKEER